MRNKLTIAEIKKHLKTPGRYGDGDGLWLYVKKSSSKSNPDRLVASWVFIFIRDGIRREIGFGGYGEAAGKISLTKARARADEARDILADGGDPTTELSFRRTVQKTVTFEDCFNEYFETLKPTFKNEKHAQQWPYTINHYAKSLLKLDIKAVDERAVRTVLKPIWNTKSETASRLRGRIERVLDYATALKLRSGDNPARLKGNIDHLLGKQKSKKQNFTALHYRKVPEFMERLSAIESFGAKALQLTILCATRTSETLLATWDEIDFENEVWTIPAERMKAEKEHRIPLTPSAMAILQDMHKLKSSDYIFPGRSFVKPMSNMTMLKVLRDMEVPCTVHGFRSSFRDFAGDETNFPREVAEQALAHVVADATEAAYRRSDALERRRALMEAWSSYLVASDSCVIDFRGNQNAS